MTRAWVARSLSTVDRAARVVWLGRPANALGVALLALGTTGPTAARGLLAVGWGLLAWAMFVRNAVMDAEIDRCAHAERVGLLASTTAGVLRRLQYIATAVGLGCLAAAAPYAMLLGGLAVAVMWHYSTIKRHSGLAANWLVGVAVAAAGTGTRFPHSQSVALLLVSVAFLIASRELRKDVLDRHWDAPAGRRTLPVLVGTRLSTRVIHAIGLAGALLVIGAALCSPGIAVKVIAGLIALSTILVLFLAVESKQAMLISKIALFLTAPALYLVYRS